jgi:hypothetical protein
VPKGAFEKAKGNMKVVAPLERIPAPSTFSSKHKGTLCRNRTLVFSLKNRR